MDVLNLWQDDPEELLLDLGFGAEEPDISVRIPARFINHPSQARGINIQVFLQAQQNRIDIENPDVRNRFREIEVLQQVTTAFNALVGGSAQSAAKPMTRQVSEETRERRKRVGMLFRKASKKSLSQRANLRSQQPDTPELPGDSPLDKRILMRRASLSPLIEEQTPFSEGAEPIEPEPPPQDKNGGREPKNDMSNAIGSSHRSPGETAESFELEEIQSFDEGIPGSCAVTGEGFQPGNDRPYLSWVGPCLVRTNSCQSDSSGFLEEPFVPANPSPGPELMKVLNAMSGDSTDGQHKSVDLQDTELQPSVTDSDDDRAELLVHKGNAAQTDCLVNIVQQDLPGRPDSGNESTTQLKDLLGLQGDVGENDMLEKDSLSQADCVNESNPAEKDWSCREGRRMSKDLPDHCDYGGENTKLQKDLPGRPEYSVGSATLQNDLPGHRDYTIPKDSPNPPRNAQVWKQKSVETLMNFHPEAGAEPEPLSSTDGGCGGPYSGRSVSVQMRSNSQSSLKGTGNPGGPSAAEQRRDSFLRGDVENVPDRTQNIPSNHPSPDRRHSQNNSTGVRGFGQHSSSQDIGRSFEEDSRWRATLSGEARCCGSCQHKRQGRNPENQTAEGQDHPQTGTSLPYSMEELVGMMRCMWRFRKMISEIEDRLEEEQASVFDSLSQEHRAEVENIMKLRTAVKQEAGLLEQQLSDILQAYDENFKMKMNRLLDEQSHLCTELRFTSHSSHTPQRSIGVQCSLLTDTPNDSRFIQDGGWSPGGKADKLNFVGFIRSLKDESENDSLE